MKIVVTGALGYLGSAIIRQLPYLNPKAEIVLLDNLASQRYVSLFHLPENGNFRFIEADILHFNLHEILQRHDIVIHLAALAQPELSLTSSEKYSLVNVIGTHKVAQSCAKAGAKLLFLSTTSVYGKKEGLVDEETAADIKPQNPYAESKWMAECFIHELGQTVGLQYTILRCGTVFGPSIGMHFDTALNRFCWQAFLHHPLTVWKTALHQIRPYLELGDAVEAILFVIKKELWDRKTYNVLSLNAQVDDAITILREYYPELAIRFVESQIMNQLNYTVSNQSLRELGFEFHGSLRKGIRETLAWLGKSTGAAIPQSS